MRTVKLAFCARSALLRVQCCRWCARSTLSRVQAWSMSRDRKLFVATPPLQTLSRHKIFCRDRKGLALGKLCCDTRGALSGSKHPVPAPNPVTTLNFCRDTRPTNLCHGREGLYRDLNHPACLGTVSRHGDACRDTEPARPSQACLGRVMHLA